ncbi:MULTISPECIES: hypothetical protein [unclassified Streptomyces]|uniref:hypothetical protein n=1 Tax=unclassified Streptomyces TaxID=2593676 RepID=UPI003D93EA1E
MNAEPRNTPTLAGNQKIIVTSRASSTLWEHRSLTRGSHSLGVAKPTHDRTNKTMNGMYQAVMKARLRHTSQSFGAQW